MEYSRVDDYALYIRISHDHMAKKVFCHHNVRNMRDIFKFVHNYNYINPTQINPMLLSIVTRGIRDCFNLQVQLHNKWVNTICITPIWVTMPLLLTITSDNKKAVCESKFLRGLPHMQEWEHLQATICMAFKVKEIEAPGCNSCEIIFGTATRQSEYSKIDISKYSHHL